MAQKPLLLKDYLELDPNSDSDSDSCNRFASFPRKPACSITVRFLLEAERCSRSGSGGPTTLIRSRSKSGRCALTKISAAISNAVKNFPLSSPTRPRPNRNGDGDGSGSGILSRSVCVSKKLSKKLWKKKEKEEEHKVTVKDIVRLNSFELYGERNSLYFPSPVVSSCSSCSDGDDERSESFLSHSSSSGNSVNSSSPRRSHDRPRSPAEVKSQGLECKAFQSEEEKEQQSPVSVMDFPYQGDVDEDEEDGASSLGFDQSLANIERTTHQLLQKIRRFESLADLDPLDLEFGFASSEGDKTDNHVASPDEITAWDLIRRLKANHQLGPQTETLLMDYFLEALAWTAGTMIADVEGMVSAAGDWINSRGCLKPEVHGRAQLAEMERNGRWKSFEDGKDDVAADVEGKLFGSLMQELVFDLTDGLGR